MSKKKKGYLFLHIIMLLLTVIAIICAATVKGGGFLDLSNIAEIICWIAAFAFGAVSSLAFARFRKTK